MYKYSISIIKKHKYAKNIFHLWSRIKNTVIKECKHVWNHMSHLINHWSDKDVASICFNTCLYIMNIYLLQMCLIPSVILSGYIVQQTWYCYHGHHRFHSGIATLAGNTFLMAFFDAMCTQGLSHSQGSIRTDAI